jgi:hypothetical protein
MTTFDDVEEMVRGIMGPVRVVRSHPFRIGLTSHGRCLSIYEPHVNRYGKLRVEEHLRPTVYLDMQSDDLGYRLYELIRQRPYEAPTKSARKR